MTPFDQFLAELRTADEQATDAPWKAEYGLDVVSPGGLIATCDGYGTTDEDDANASAIALLRNTLAQTIAIMEVARKALEAGARVESLKADLASSLRLERELREEGHRYLGPPDPKSGMSETPESKDWRKRLRKADLETRRLTIDLQTAHEALPGLTSRALASMDALAAKTL